jgi:hypothetical protein
MGQIDLILYLLLLLDAALIANLILQAERGQNVGGGLPPMVVDHLCMQWLTHCYRGQAPSHIWISMGQIDLVLYLLLLLGAAL